MTTEHKPHSEPVKKGYQALDVLQSAYDHGHPDDLALCPDAFDTLEGLLEQYQAARTALEGVDVFYGEAIGLIGELREDAELIYVADKGLPPHIEKARDLTDHEETLAQARAVLYPARSHDA